MRQSHKRAKKSELLEGQVKIEQKKLRDDEPLSC